MRTNGYNATINKETRDDEGVCRRQETAAAMAIARKDGCSRQESDNNEIGGGRGKDGLVATMIG